MNMSTPIKIISTSQGIQKPKKFMTMSTQMIIDCIKKLTQTQFHKFIQAVPFHILQDFFAILYFHSFEIFVSYGF